MILRAMILFAIASGLVVYIIALVRRNKTIRAQWNGAVRHVVALVMGWVGFGILSGLLVLLDLFEAGKFSMTNFANALFAPLIIFIVGMIVLRICLITSDR
jgi:hypothetical protein